MGCIGTVIFPLQWIYFFVIGASGRQMAWKNKQFPSREDYSFQMNNWHVIGLVLFVINILYWIFAGFFSALDSSASAINLFNYIN